MRQFLDNNPIGKALVVIAFVAVAAVAYSVTTTDAAFTDGMEAVSVMGQYDANAEGVFTPVFTKYQEGDYITRTAMRPTSVALDHVNHRLFVASWVREFHGVNLPVDDYGFSRIQVFDLDENDVPLDPYPDNVLGQADWNGTDGIPEHVGASAEDFDEVAGMVYDSVDDRLFVMDRSYSRVLVFDTTTIDDHESAVNVLGAPSLTSTDGGEGTINEFDFPSAGLAYDEINKRLFVADQNNARILVFNLSGGIVDGEDAVAVLGQTNFTSGTYALTPTSNDFSFLSPVALAYDPVNNRLFAADTSMTSGGDPFHRVLVFDTTSISNGEDAVYVLGEPNFTSDSGGVVAENRLTSPVGLAYDGMFERLYVQDQGGNRVMVFDVDPGSIVNGSSAVEVIGQPDFVTGDANTTQDGFNFGIAFDGSDNLYTPAGGLVISPTTGALFVADYGNNRVVRYATRGDALASGMDADAVFGQAVFTTAAAGTTATALSTPAAVAIDSLNGRAFVADNNNNRVLVFDISDGVTSGEAAINVLGQNDANTNLDYFDDAVAATTQNGLSQPYGVAWDAVGERLFVGDKNNNRVLVYDLSGGISNGMNALSVLGQPDFISSAGATTQNGLNGAYAVAFNPTSNWLFVSGYDSHRVSVFDTSSISHGEAALAVIGQQDFVSSGSAVTQNGMSYPSGLAYDDARYLLYVSEIGGNRVMVYDTTALDLTGEIALKVLGQNDFVSSGTSVSQTRFDVPVGMAYDAARDRLFLTGGLSGHRTLVFTDVSAAATVNEPADFVLGQANFTDTGGATAQDRMSFPTGAGYDSLRDILFVPDRFNHRVLAFNLATDLLAPAMSATDVLGQCEEGGNGPCTPSFTSAVLPAGPSASAFSDPDDVALDLTNHMLFVSDNVHNRVLVFELDSGNDLVDPAADFVIGQSDFHSSGAGTLDALSLPRGLAVDEAGQRLFVVDPGNHRVSVFDTSSLGAGFDGDLGGLGQPDNATAVPLTTQNALSAPGGAAFSAALNLLFVADTGNNRVMVFDVGDGVTYDEAAVNVLGQSNFTDATAATTQSGMDGPYSVAIDDNNGLLFVLEANNSRILAYDISGGISDGMAATYVLGQSDFTSSDTATTQSGFDLDENHLEYDAAEERLFVTDEANSRVLAFHLACGIVNGMPAHSVLGQPDFTSLTPAVTQDGLVEPIGVAYDSGNDRLYVSDEANRIVIYEGDGAPVTCETPVIPTGHMADGVLGQFTPGGSPTFTKGNVYNGQDPFAGPDLEGPGGIVIDTLRHYAYVLDSYGRRVLRFDLDDNNQPLDSTPDAVFGQADFTSVGASAASQITLNQPAGIALALAADRLFVSDTNNGRVLAFDSASTSNTFSEPADVVFGAADFDPHAAGESQQDIATPFGIAYDSVHDRLFVADPLNSRVIVFDGAATAGSHALADQIIGQVSWTTSTGVSTQATLNAPFGLAYDGDNGHDRLFVSELYDGRVVQYDGITTAGDAPLAHRVFGQSSFVGTGSFGCGDSFCGLAAPFFLEVDSGSDRLFVADLGVNRVTVFDGVTASALVSEPADHVLGQIDFTTFDSPTVGYEDVDFPAGMVYDAANDRLIVSETDNNRINTFDVSPGYFDGYPGRDFFDVEDIYDGEAVGMSGSMGVAIDHELGWLFVGEAGSSRVLVYELDENGELVDLLPDHVIGQPVLDEVVTHFDVDVSTTNFTVPMDIVIDPVNHLLYVADAGGNRVPVFDVTTITDGEPAVKVLGQDLFTSFSDTDEADGMQAPLGLDYDVDRDLLFLADSENNRVLIFADASSLATGDPATYVIGQDGFGLGHADPNSGESLDASGLDTPTDVEFDSTTDRLFVADFSNLRVLVFDVSEENLTLYPTGMEALAVLGQDNTTSNGSNPVASNTLATPFTLGLDEAGQRLFVSDFSNNRVMMFGVAAIVDGEPAIDVYGQIDMDSGVAATTQDGLNFPTRTWYDVVAERLYISDAYNNRVVWHDLPVPPSAQLLPDTVIGQYDNDGLPTFTKGGDWDAPSRFVPNSHMSDAEYDSVNHRFFLADDSNNRVLVYDLDINNAFLDFVPDLVIGQADFVSGTEATDQSTLNGTNGWLSLAYDPTGERLFVGDGGNGRVLVFNADPDVLASGDAALSVIGHDNFDTAGYGTTQSNIGGIPHLAFDDEHDRLYVGDHLRVLVFDVSTVSDGEPALNVLGQPDFTSSAGTTSISVMTTPAAVTYDPNHDRLYVADGSRIMAYDVASISNGENATHYLGAQPDFDTNSPGWATSNSLDQPAGLEYDAANDRLFVSDGASLTSPMRVMVFDGSAVVSGMAAMNLLGQPDFITQAFQGNGTYEGLELPFGLAYESTSNTLAVTDLGMYRALFFEVGSIVDGEAALNVISVDSRGIEEPLSVELDSVNHRLFVGEEDGRILVYDLNGSNMMTDFVPDHVLGAPNFSSSGYDASTTQSSGVVTDLAYDAVHDRLYTIDSSNHRALAFDTDVIIDGEPAVLVLGQPDFTSSSSGDDEYGMNQPYGIAYDDSTDRLFVVDTFNHRVLVYEAASSLAPTGEPADAVIGQTAFGMSGSGTSASSLFYPFDATYDAGSDLLFVADGFNHRVLAFDLATLSSGAESAVYVLGQENMSSGSSNRGGSIGAGTHSAPWRLDYDQVRDWLLVSDFEAAGDNNRSVVYDLSDGIANGMDASYVIGQPDFVTSIELAVGEVDQDNVMIPAAASFGDEVLYLADYSHSRILVFGLPTQGGGGGGGGGGGDSSAPVIGSVSAAGVTQTGVSISWSTNEGSTSVLRYGLTTGYGDEVSDYAFVTSHSFDLSDLTPGTTYYFEVCSTDSAANQACSGDHTFQTLSPPGLGGGGETPVPGGFSSGPLISGISVTGITATSANVAWMTDTASDSVVEYGLSDTFGLVASSSLPATLHSVQLTDLLPGNLYNFRVSSQDASAMKSVSASQTFTTLATPVQPIPEVPEEVPAEEPAEEPVVPPTEEPSEEPATETESAPGEEPVDEPSEEPVVPPADEIPAPPETSARPTSGICGNGICEPTETANSCAADCAVSMPTAENPTVNRNVLVQHINPNDVEFYGGRSKVRIALDGITLAVPAGTFITLHLPDAAIRKPIESAWLQVDADSYKLRPTGSFTGEFFTPASFGDHSMHLVVQYSDSTMESVDFILSVRPPGQVYEAVEGGNQPVAGARVTLLDESGKSIAVWDGETFGQVNPVVVANGGEYVFVVSPGVYRLQVEREGYGTRTTLPFPAQSMVDMSLELVRLPVEPLDEIRYLTATLGVELREARANPYVRQAAQSAGVAALAIAALNTAAAGATAATTIPYLAYLASLFTQPTQLLGRRRREKWGVVYHALSKLPVDLAIVRLLDAASGRVIRSTVTDKEGRYFFIVTPGAYKLQVVKAGFVYPSALVAHGSIDARFLDVNAGASFVVDADGVVAKNVPLDPIGAEKSPRKVLLEGIARRAQHAIGIVAILAVAAAAFMRPAAPVIALLVANVASYLLFRRLAVPAAPKRWGKVTDESGKPLSNAVVRVFETKFNKLLETQVTDLRGRYAFLVGQNAYAITVEHPLYEKVTRGPIDLSNVTTAEAEVIAEDVSLKKRSRPGATTVA